ncbi:MAG: signal peptidase I [Lachnospiraceae bacterium]|nr:signal peptidase I [Lachnospiraceae bacterium]MDD6618253.1 signal peptidase I [Clostridiales bacterium]MDY4770291.1 signal peptidase I [Lachnospiraceae bacterium]
MEEKKKNAVLSEVLDYVKVIVFAVVFVLIVNNFILINALVPSESMEKTIMTGDRIFGFRLAYEWNEPERFDIVIFKYPDDPEQKELYIKRIIGLPGETINIVNGKVYIDGKKTPLDDSFCPETPIGDFGPYTVPEGCYFMLGDNRNCSKDSRFWENTYVREDQIVGKAVLRYYPSIKLMN